MFKTSKGKLIIISIFLIFIIFISIIFILVNFNIQKKQVNSSLVLKKVDIVPINTLTLKKAPSIVKNQYKSNNWRIQIPKINLDAPILEGTSKEILRRGVGHFTSTGISNRKYMSSCS